MKRLPSKVCEKKCVSKITNCGFHSDKETALTIRNMVGKGRKTSLARKGYTAKTTHVEHLKVWLLVNPQLCGCEMLPCSTKSQ